MERSERIEIAAREVVGILADFDDVIDVSTRRALSHWLVELRMALGVEPDMPGRVLIRRCE